MGSQSVASKLKRLREVQAWAGIPVYVEQYAPWNLGTSSAYTREPDDFSWSKAHEWAATCGEYGCVGPMRWPEIRPFPKPEQWWGVAHPNMARIAGVTWEYAQHVDLNDWHGHGRAWDDRITSPDLSLKSSWGDGEHVTAFLQWDNNGEKALSIKGLANQRYTVRVFDWITGELTTESECDPVNDVLDLVGVPTVQHGAALYVSPAGGSGPPDEPPDDPPEEPEPETLRVVLHVMDGDDVRATYAGELEAVG